MSEYNDLRKASPNWVVGQGPQAWVFEDDFNDLNLSTTSALAKWTHLTTDAGNTALLSLTKGCGVLKLENSTPTDEDVIHMQANSGFISGTDFMAGMPIEFDCRFQIADASHSDLHIGFSIPDTSMAASEPVDFCAFRMVAADADGALDLISQKDSVEQVVSSICLVQDATWVRAGFVFYPTAGNTDSGRLDYTVHHNGSVLRGTMTLANTWPDDVWISPIIQVQIEGTDSDIHYFDYVRAAGVRASWVDGTG